ncbi:hypothetical protein RB608_08230 [Nocardioides sp. LHD-245]|uniref:hypothetical protein n=1 Tax=Nocardioides sp. LHD-245 TaxID=3051387 RepID=UPI0027DEE95F|nr:hypothetical protein [Nocardioides sp. LHD-245]
MTSTSDISEVPMRRTTIAGLVAGLTLVAAPVPAGASPSVTSTVSPVDGPVDSSQGIAERGKRGWTTLRKKAGAKVQACQFDRPGFYGVQVRVDARTAKRRVKARSHIQHFENGVWTGVVVRASPWRSRGEVVFDSFISGMKYPVRARVRIKTTSSSSPFTGWVDPVVLKHCR